MTLLEQLYELSLIYKNILQLIEITKKNNVENSNELSQQQTDLIHYNKQLKGIDTKIKALTLEVGALKITDAFLKSSSNEKLQKVAEEYMPNFLLKGAKQNEDK